MPQAEGLSLTRFLILRVWLWSTLPPLMALQDAYGILTAVSSFSGGAAAAIEAFEIEKQANNPAMAIALETLARDFIHPDGAGPRLARLFRFGSSQEVERGLRLQTDLVAIAQALLGE